MARFTFTIESEEEHEMSGLMVRLFNHKQTTPVSRSVEDATMPELKATSKVAPKTTAKARIEPLPEVIETPVVDVEPEITFQMVKDAGSVAMGKIKASGVSSIMKQHGGGAETFAGLDPSYFEAVYTAFNEAS